MNKPTLVYLAVRVHPHAKKRMLDLKKLNKVKNVSAFVREAIEEKLENLDD